MFSKKVAKVMCRDYFEPSIPRQSLLVDESAWIDVAARGFKSCRARPKSKT
jgi:hypothetical protein